MTAGLDLVSQMTPQNAGGGLGDAGAGPAKAPSTDTERFWSSFNTFMNAPDDYWNARNSQSDRFDKISNDYHSITGERLANPYDVSITREEMRKYPNMPIPYVLQKRLSDARDKTRAMRTQMSGGNPEAIPDDFLNVDSINPSIGHDGEAMRRANDALVGTGGGMGGFLGELVGGAAQPHNVVAGLVPVSRLPMAVAEGIGRTFLGNVGREALLQAGVQSAGQVAGEVVGYGTREQFGTAPTVGEMAGHVLGAGGGGAVFGGGLRATHLALHRLIHGPQAPLRPGEYGPAIEVPQTVKDAAVVMQTGDLYGPMNKLGIPEPAHDRAFLSAADSVARGHGAAVDVITGYHGSPHDFVQFESRPRTGEGSNAYGHGTYIAENRAVAETYQQVGQATTPEQMAREYLDAAMGDRAAAIAKMQDHAMAPAGVGYTAEQAALVREGLAVLKSDADLSGVRSGNLYEVQAKHGVEELLDWDKPLREQTPEILEKLKAAFADVPKQGVKSSEQRLQDLIDQGAKGEDAYMWLATMKGVEAGGQADQALASRALADAGIPGHGFLDAGSRADGTGTRNMVIYDPASLEVAKKNDELVRLADEVRNPVVEEGRPDFAAAAKPTPPEEVAPKTAAVRSAEDKAVIAEAQALIDAAEGKPVAPAVSPEARAVRQVTPEQYESVGRVAELSEIFTPAEIPEGKLGAKKAFLIDPDGRLIDVSEIGHPEANARLNELAGLGRDHEGGFYGGDSPVVRIDATVAYDTLSIGVNAYEGGVTPAQKRMIDRIERRVAIDTRRGENIMYQGEVSKDYAGAPVGDLKSVKIREEAAPPVPAPREPTTEIPAELRKAFAQATVDEAEAAIAVACITGGGAL